MKTTHTLFLLSLLWLLSGCVALSTADVAVIDAAKGNADEWNTRFQATTQPTADQWANSQAFSNLNAANWNAISSIAHKTPVTPAGK